MGNNFTDDLLADIFGVTKQKNQETEDEDSSDDSHDAAYAEVADEVKGETFEDRAKAINDKISPATKEEVEYVDIATPPAEAKPASKEKEKVNARQTSNDFERILEESVSNKSDAKVKNPEVESRTGKTLANVDNQPVSEVRSPIRSEPGHDRISVKEPEKTAEIPEHSKKGWNWVLESSSSSLDLFYEKKKGLMPVFLVRGELPFERYRDEIINARVNIKDVGLEDRELIASKMKDVQVWKDRLVEIRSNVTSQLYPMKRIVALLRGELAVIKPAKNVIQQDGNNSVHLYDFENYLSHLESLHENCRDVINNLDSCFEVLSRIATLAQPGRGIERYEGPFVPKPMSKPAQPEVVRGRSKASMDDYDVLELTSVKDYGKKQEQPIKKRESEWGDIG